MEQKLSTAPSPNPKYQGTDIGELHSRFYASSEQELLDAESFLEVREEELKKWEDKELANESKVNVLKKLGFTSVKQSTRYDEEKEKKRNEIACARRDIEDKTDIAEAVKYFALKYPAYKFITYNGIKEICEKYGLVFGQNSLFTGFVPQENLEHIETFWDWREETDGVIMEDRAFRWSTSIRSSYYNSINDKTFITYGKVASDLKYDYRSEIRDSYPENYRENNEDHKWKSNWRDSIDNYFTEEEIKASDKASWNSPDRIGYSEFLGRYVKKNFKPSEHELKRACMDELFIAAPVEDMDMEGKRVVDFEVVPEEAIKQVEDPVIFYPVSHGKIAGGLIITAWGDEAEDPLVKNEKLN